MRNELVIPNEKTITFKSHEICVARSSVKTIKMTKIFKFVNRVFMVGP